MAAIEEHGPGVDLDDLFAEAEGRCGLKRETVAALMGIKATQLTQQLHGQGHVSLGRVLAMWCHTDPDGQRFVQSVFAVAAERLGFGGFDPVTDAALTVIVALTSKLRMARAALPQQERKRGVA